MIITRYIFKTIILRIIYFLSITVSLIWLIQSIKYFEFIASRCINFFTFFCFTGLLLPDLITLSMPFIFCLGATYAYYQLHQKKELPVMGFLGFSKKILMKPLIAVGVLCFVCQTVMQVIAPLAFGTFLAFEKDVRENISLSIFQPSKFNVLENHIIFFERKQDQAMENIFVAFFQKDKNTFLTAKKAFFEGTHIALDQGYQIDEDPKHGTFTTVSFTHLNYELPVMREESSLYRRILRSGLFDLFYDTTRQAKNEALTRIAKVLLPLLSLPVLIWGIFYRLCFLRTVVFAFLFNAVLMVLSKLLASLL